MRAGRGDAVDYCRGQSETFWSAGFGTADAQGGVCIAIAETLCSAIEDRGIVVPRRAQWIILHIGEDRIGFLNVYAPNVANGRAEFWTLLGDSLPTADHWCVGGDFNMLEDPEDRRGGSFATIQGAELAAWERLCFSLRISDVWHADAFDRA